MNKIDQTFVSLLRNSNINLTKQRELIFNSLLDQEPLTLNELITKTEGKVDRASVYRTIRLFEELGVTKRVNQGWKYKVELSDKFAEHHHHLFCRKCQNIIPINEDTLEKFISLVAAQYKFVPEDHQVEIQGLCSKCALDR